LGIIHKGWHELCLWDKRFGFCDKLYFQLFISRKSVIACFLFGHVSKGNDDPS
jgi:hypothetical protein